MTLCDCDAPIARIRRLVLACLSALAAAFASPGLHAQSQLTQAVRVDAVIGSLVKVQFDRGSVQFDTDAYDPATVLPVEATPLTVTTKARVPGNTRIVLTVQAGGPFVSASSTIPANRLSWTTSGPGFQAGGSANPNAARMVGSWRGSGVWTGTQIYTFEDSWTYAVGVYTMTMTYTVSAP
jgi:hypothetical protein